MNVKAVVFSAKDQIEIRELRDCRYDKWVLIEQDTHLRAPENDLKISSDFLKQLFS